MSSLSLGSRALVKAATLEVLIDPQDPTQGTKNLICGYCGTFSSSDSAADSDVQGSEAAGCDHEVEWWRDGCPKSAVCPRCGVQNIDGDLETYLREKRELLEDCGVEEGDEAALHKAMAERQRGNGPVALLSLARSLERNECMHEALAVYRQAVQMNPEFATVHQRLADALRKKGARGEAIAEYRETLRLQPGNLRAQEILGQVLLQEGRLEEAVGLFHDLIRQRPDDVAARERLGAALLCAGRHEEAEQEFREVLRMQPRMVEARLALGDALYAQRKLAEAEEQYQNVLMLPQATALQRADAYNRLGRLLLEGKGDADGARAVFFEMCVLRRFDAEAHYNLGRALAEQDMRVEAFRAYVEAIRLKADFAEPHCNLGHLLKRVGEYDAALKFFRRGHELGSRRADWPYPSAEWIRETEQLLAMQAALPAFLRGEYQPKDNAERLALLHFCEKRRFHRAGARLYVEAFAADPNLAEEPEFTHRFKAAAHASLVGSGEGQDACETEESERAHWRRQAVAWLRADLTRLVEFSETGTPARHKYFEGVAEHWLCAPYFAGLREPAAMALPPDERQACQQLWADVKTLLSKSWQGPDNRTGRVEESVS